MLFRKTPNELMDQLISRSRIVSDKFEKISLSKSFRPINEKERYYLKRRSAIIQLSFAYAFYLAKTKKLEKIFIRDEIYKLWSEYTYQNLLSNTPFNIIAETINLHKMRSIWDKLLENSTSEAIFSIKREINLEKKTPTASYLTFESDVFYGRLFEHSILEIEDSTSVWMLPFFPKKLRYARFQPSNFHDITSIKLICDEVYCKGLKQIV